ncbi:NAD-dependent epimerase/dehydratase family protein [Curtobacterium sp. PhB136]|uniref:NAD-dependent epimerase/dehydratase family protein n=1 Tax=Curtobacterium sp. PhB136 TaxID=2485181 RepID=UPI00104B40DC|nr:NAD-dependent epimerase/dehydratase family protein [Curtobacterium sp. PhB136]TCK59287.1 dTDP-L-rhamnose 4-epimerase [Curtobacterium sp. PhB136]
MTRTVLITGGAGFIGSRLAADLAGAGDDVVLLDSLHPQVHASGWPALPAGITAIPFDVTVPTMWDAVLRSVHPDVVVHLAAETGTGQSLTEASRHTRVNVVGTSELLDGLHRAGVVPERFVLASSRAVYGEGDWATASGERFAADARDVHQLERAQWDPASPDGSVATPLAHAAATTHPRPSNVYAATKLAQEHVLHAWASAHGAPLSVLRLQNVYGPGQSLTNPYTGIVSLFGRLAREHRSIPVYEDGSITRDFVFVDDVVRALAAATRSDRAGTTTVDIGSGAPMTLLDLAGVIAEQAGAPAPQVTGQYRLGDVRAAFADVTAAGALLGYEPRFDPSRGVALLLDWMATQDAPTLRAA